MLYLCTRTRASLLTLGHSSKLDGPRLTADLQPESIKNDTIMEAKKTKEEALKFIKTAIRHKQEWRKELEAEFKGKDVNVVFL